MTELSRRKVLQFGAIAAGAATGAAIPLTDFARADELSIPEGGRTNALSGLTLVPGATSRTYGVAAMQLLGTPHLNSFNGYYADGGILIDLGLPAGTLVAQLDFFGYTGSSATQSWRFVELFTTTTVGTSFADIITPVVSGAGAATQATATFAPAHRLEAGHSYLLTTSATTSATNMIVGAVAQYFPAGAIRTVTPLRVYDSRPGFSPFVGTKAPLANGTTRAVDCTVGGALPAGVRAAVVNVTVVGTSASGFLAMFRNGISWPGNSSINWDHAGTSQANTQIVELDATGKLAAYVSLGSSTDFLVDVVGYIP